MNRIFTGYLLMFRYAINAANAIEYSFVSDVSPRDESTQGTLAPMSIAPISALSNFEQHL